MRKSPLEASGFFVARTPSVPFDEFERWSDGVGEEVTRRSASETDGAQALDADRTLLRKRLARWVEQPEVREALFVASPSLLDSLPAWRRDPQSKQGRRVEPSLVRYFTRMTSRPTPFGLFAVWATGACGPETSLHCPSLDTCRRHTRLDMGYLFELTEALGELPAIRRVLRYEPNSTLYEAAAHLRYVEARRTDKARVHQLVGVEPSGHLALTLRRAEGGALLDDLAAALVEDDGDGETAFADAMAFVLQLVECQILVSELCAPVTGVEPIRTIIETLGQHPECSEQAAALTAARDALERLDQHGRGAPVRSYHDIAQCLASLPIEPGLSRLFQVDVVRRSEALSLGGAILDEIALGAEVLLRLAPRQEETVLDSFRDDFVRRYGEREVLLAEALDPEAGIGFDGRSVSQAATPILEGLDISQGAGRDDAQWQSAYGVLLEKVEEAARTGARQVELSEVDIDRMEPPDRDPMPDAVQVVGSLAARPGEDIDSEGRFFISSVSGPSGATLLGRFCHADPDLEQAVRAHLASEESLRPEAVYAEIVHNPGGRVGNVLSRPVLRTHEIPFLGSSGAASENQLPLSDLTISVEGARIILQSRRLQREVVPRLTTAHAFANDSLAVYRFLCLLQYQDNSGGFEWQWGPLETLGYLPRVACGRTVLARAQWRLDARALESLDTNDAASAFRAMQAIRDKAALPRYVVLPKADQELLVDLQNALSVASLINQLKGVDGATLIEFFPGPDELVATGPEGRFVHQIVVPFVRQARSEQPVSVARQPRRRRPLATPRYAPGSEWLYVKLFSGAATCDRLLRTLVAPLVLAARQGGLASKWFFIRYGEPSWHLRLRFLGQPSQLRSDLLARLHTAAAPFLADGSLSRIQLDTYEPELTRYGGPTGLEIAESIFCVDSESVISLVDGLTGDRGLHNRWLIGLLGADALLDDFGFDLAAKTTIADGMRRALSTEFFQSESDGRRQLGAKYREMRGELSDLFAQPDPREPALAMGKAVLRARSAGIAPFVAKLRAEEGALGQPLAELATTFIHMYLNRLLRSEARAQEAVIYEFLHRHYRSLAARRGGH